MTKSRFYARLLGTFASKHCKISWSRPIQSSSAAVAQRNLSSVSAKADVALTQTWPSALKGVVPGMLSGFVQSSTGTAGGITMVWSLTQILKMPQVVAAGTSLPTQLCGNSMAVYVLAQGGCVDFPAAILICVPGAVASIVGARIAHRLPDVTLQLFFSGALLLAGPLILWRVAHTRAREHTQTSSEPHRDVHESEIVVTSDCEAGNTVWELCQREWQSLLTLIQSHPSIAGKHVMAGCVMGTAMGALGIGAGPILMTYFALVTEDTSQKVAVATTNCAMLPPLLTASLTHLKSGGVSVGLLPVLCVGTVAGGWAGASFAMHGPEEWLKIALGLSLPIGGTLAGMKALKRLRAAG